MQISPFLWPLFMNLQCYGFFQDWLECLVLQRDNEDTEQYSVYASIALICVSPVLCMKVWIASVSILCCVITPMLADLSDAPCRAFN